MIYEWSISVGRYKKLGKNIALLTLGNFASKILSFLLVPFYTAVLSTAEYGSADMLTTTVNLILPIFTLMVYEAVMRFALDEFSDNKQVFSSGLYITLIGCGILLLMAQGMRLSKKLTPSLWLFVLYFISLAFYNLILQFVKGIEKVSVYSMAGVINTFVYIITNIFFLVTLKLGVTGYLLAFVIGHTVAAIYAFFRAGVYKYVIDIRNIEKEICERMCKYSIPMIPNSISWWISNSSDKYILTFFCGVSINGIYSVAYKIPSILTICINIFISAWQISAVEDFGSAESKKFYASIYDKYESILFVGASILIGVTQILAKYLYSNDFYKAWLYVPILILASVFNSLAAFYGSIYTSAKKTKMLLYSTLIGAIGNIVLNVLLIPKFAAMGAAIATMISYLLVWIVRVIDSRRIFKFNMKVKRDILIYSVLGMETILICMNYNMYYIVSIISIGVVCVGCRNVFKEILHLIKK